MTRRDRILLGLLVLGSLALRLWRLDAQSLWIDEYLMLLRASIGEPFRWGDWFVNPQGPLPALVLRASVALFGTAEWALRLPSALAGAATVPLVYLLARRLGRAATGPVSAGPAPTDPAPTAPAAAWSAALLAAFSPFLIWYSQETRHYALGILAAAWSAIAFLDLVDRPPTGRRVALYMASLLVGLMSHLATAFLIAAHALVVFFWRRDRWKLWAMAVVPALLLFSPWIWVTITRNVNLAHVAASGPIPEGELLRGESTFSWLGIPYTFFVLLAGYSLGPTLVELHDAPRLATVMPHLVPILALALGAALLGVGGMAALRRDRAHLGLVLLGVAVPLLGVTLLSMRNAKVFHPRYVAVALPLLLVLLGAGFAWWRVRRPAAAWLAVLLMASSLALALANYYGNSRYAREDNRGAARILADRAVAEDIVLAQGAPQLLDWYDHGPAPVVVVYEPWVRDRAGLDARLDGWAAGRRHVWLMSVRPWLQDPKLMLRAALDARWGPGEVHALNGVTLIRYDRKGAP
jgi:uncharacterized membrane protein